VQVTSADGTVAKPYSVTVTNPLAQTIAIQATAENLTFTLHGMPDAKVTVQSAPTVAGPWAVEKVLALDGSGTGTVNLDHDNHLSARFYRTMSE
jgi:hypothetical protein